jgi:hypothetical protein
MSDALSADRFWLLTGAVPDGRFTRVQLREKLAGGQITWQTLACPVGGGTWLPLLQTPGFGPGVGAGQNATTAPSANAPAGAQPLPGAAAIKPTEPTPPPAAFVSSSPPTASDPTPPTPAVTAAATPVPNVPKACHQEQAPPPLSFDAKGNFSDDWPKVRPRYNPNVACATRPLHAETADPGRQRPLYLEQKRPCATPPRAGGGRRPFCSPLGGGCMGVPGSTLPLLMICLRPLHPPLLLAKAALLSLVILSSVGCKDSKTASQTKQEDHFPAAIREVLAKDQAASTRFRREEKDDRLDAVRRYCQALRRIDLRQCPNDFQEAFLKHIYAWEELVPLLEKFDGLTGDLMSLFEVGSSVVTKQSLTTEGDREFARVRQAISATYFEVEKAALRYGVQAGQR